MRVQCGDWFGITSIIFGSSLMVSYFEYRSGYPYFFESFNAFNAALFVFVYYTTYCNVTQKVEGTDESNQRIKYIIRVLISVSYAMSPLLCCLIRSVVDKKLSTSIYSLLVVYACYSSVFLCVLNFPEKYVSQGSVDIFVCVKYYKISYIKSVIFYMNI